MASQPVMDMELRPKQEIAQAESPVAAFERLARDPDVSVEKIERLMALWERAQERQSEAAFNAAMTDAQREMGPIVARGWNPETQSKYRKYEDIDRVIRPIYTAHGFAMSFGTADTDKPDEIRVTCRVSHKAGHARDYAVNVPSDGKGIKGGVFMTRTHATGSGLTYGKRYLADLIWNLAMTQDDDGNRASGKHEPKAPAGWDQWWLDFQSTADEGVAALEAAWKATKRELRDFAAQRHQDTLKALKTKARQADEARKAQS